MTKKNYKEVAEIIKEIVITAPYTAKDIADSFDIYFRNDNPLYKSNLFYTACGLDNLKKIEEEYNNK